MGATDACISLSVRTEGNGKDADHSANSEVGTGCIRFTVLENVSKGMDTWR